jgi:hypothetical protein
MGGAGAPPHVLWRALAIPAYAVHLGLSLALPGGFFVYAALFVGAAVAADLLRQRQLGIRQPRS